MAEGITMNHLFASNGKANIFGWIFFIATLILVGFALYQSYLTIKKMQVSEEGQVKKLKELEMNLREVRGAQYKDIK